MDIQIISKFIEQALIEDVGNGDHTSLSTIPMHTKGKAQLIIKEEGVIAGVALAEMIFKKVNAELQMHTIITDGAWVKPGDIAFTVEGDTHAILLAERLVLNCMQRMSAIATKTHHLTQMIQSTHAKLLDTRKTTPNFRYFEKWAVAIGGGVNHRFGLYDMILIKDNHVDYAGGVTKAIQAANNYLVDKQLNIPIEIEVRNMEELQEALQVQGRLDRIMFDNFTPETMKQAVVLVDGRFSTEASGGITEKNILSYAQTGVDYISVGALTHAVKSLDMSLKAYK